MEKIIAKAAMLGSWFKDKDLTLATAESCTGGLLSSVLTEVAGSSQYFRGGIVAYHNDVKEQVLGVQTDDLLCYGAVSSQVAKAMALGVKRLLGADMGISITGIAGPGGGSIEKPVGLVYLGLSFGDVLDVRELRLSGMRQEIRQDTVQQALNMIEAHLPKD